MNATEISKAIINGNFTNEEINTLISAIKQAQKFTRAKSSAIAITTLKVGSFGTLTGLKPKYINGRRVEVLGINRTRVEIKEVGNDSYGGRYTVPAQCIIPE